LADSKAGLVAALVVGAVLALVVASCCWAVHRCLGRPKGRAVRRPQPGDARGAVAIGMEPVAAVVAAAAPAPPPVVAAAAPALQPAPAPVVAVAAPAPVVPGEVAARIDEAVGALDAAELQAVLAALRAVPRGGPPIPPPPPMNLRLPSIAHPPYVPGFSK